MESYEQTSEKISGQTQQPPGHEHQLNPRPIFIRDNYNGSEKLFDKVALITRNESIIPATFEKEEVEQFGKNVPLERPGQPCEVAPCYVFLASEDASYFTGQVLHPNGGKSMQS